MDLQRETRPEHSITYAEQIYEILKSQIIQNKIPSGTPLKANLIAEQMQVSISPVRDAILKLETHGWVRSFGKSKIVTLPSNKEFCDYLAIRQSLELLAFSLVKDRFECTWLQRLEDIITQAELAHRRDNGVDFMLRSVDFHLFLSQQSQNEALAQLLSDICEKMLHANIIAYQCSSSLRSHFISRSGLNLPPQRPRSVPRPPEGGTCMLQLSPLYRAAEDPSVLQLLRTVGLSFPRGPDAGIGLYDNGTLVGCGFLKGSMLQGLAIHPSYHGQNLSARLVSALIQEAACRGILHLNVITKPEMSPILEHIGFRKVVDALPYSTFLEFGPGGISVFLDELNRKASNAPENCAGIVINGNPFTLGHRYLIETASRKAPLVWVIVVEENISEFPFPVRMQLLQEGTADLPNIRILSGSEYVISQLTFPAYFTREELFCQAESTMEAAIFSQLIAPALHITCRYIGSEPTSASTAIYNRALLKALPSRGIQVEELPRKNLNGIPISASVVRSHLAAGRWEHARDLLPESTWHWLRSHPAETEQILQRIRKKNAPITS